MTKVELILDSTEEEGKWRVGLDCAAVWAIRVRIRRGRRWIMVPRGGFFVWRRAGEGF